jgi:ribonuclease VapC
MLGGSAQQTGWHGSSRSPRGVIQTYRLKVVPVDEAQWRLATEALRQFGKGRHPARLNICDSFSYALAKSLDAPLLFKGDDFTHTDIRAAL